MQLFIKLATTWIISILFLILLIITSYSIPNSLLIENVKSSTKIIQSEGMKPKIGGFFLYRLDNFTDMLMINTAIAGDSNDPVKSSMINYHYFPNSFESILSIVDNNFSGVEKVEYGRYWHGYLIVLRPLLCFFDYQTIRILNYLFLGLLLSVILYLLFKKHKLMIGIFFILSLLFINFPMIPLSMQFSTVFYIAFISIIIILINANKLKKIDNVMVLFLVIGGITSYFDLFTAPLITLGLPLIIYFTCINSINKYKNLFFITMIWCIGYVTIWSAKWLIGSYLCEVNIFNDAINQAIIRSSSYSVTHTDFDMSFKGIIKYIFHMIKIKKLWGITGSCLIILIVLITLYLYKLKHINKRLVSEYIYLLIIALMPFIWYFFIRNHSVIHIWFTWRLLSISIFSSLLFLFFTLNKKNGDI